MVGMPSLRSILQSRVRHAAKVLEWSLQSPSITETLDRHISVFKRDSARQGIQFILLFSKWYTFSLHSTNDFYRLMLQAVRRLYLLITIDHQLKI